MENFTQIFETHFLNRANLAKAMLEQNGMNAYVINKINSQFQFMEDKAAVFVADQDADLALKLIEQLNDELM
jgi:hypothetical protein